MEQNENNQSTEETINNAEKTEQTQLSVEAVPPASTPTVAPVVIKQSSGKGMALGALVLSLIALGGTGLLFVQGQNVLENAKRDYQSRLDKAALGQSDNAQRLQESLSAQQTLKQDYAALQGSLDETRTQLSATQNDYRSLVGSRMEWMVNEIEYTLNTTAQQLMFNGDTQATINTLTTLEKRLNRFDAPELLPIKQGINQDLKALATQPTMGMVAASQRLDKLVTRADNLPLLMDNLLVANTPQTEAIPTANVPWYENLWQGIRNNMGHLVEVRKINNPDAMMLSPDQVYFVRQNIKLRLLDARLALIERQPEIYRDDLNAVMAEVTRYFDTKSAAVSAWLDEATALKEMDVRAPQLDVLKNSLAAVRAYQKDTVEVVTPPAASELASSAPVAQTEQAAPVGKETAASAAEGGAQ